MAFAFVDAGLIAMTYMAALVLRLADTALVSPEFWRNFWLSLPVIVLTHIFFNLVFGAYGHVWEHASVAEAMRLVTANVVSAFVLLVGSLAYEAATGRTAVPLMALALGAVLTLGGMGALRFRSRLFSFRRSEGSEPVRTLVIGTGRAAASLARYGHTFNPPLHVVAFVPEAEQKSQRRLAEVPVLGSLAHLDALIDPYRVDQVVIAADLDEDQMRSIVDACLEVSVRLRIVPDMSDALQETGGVRDIRDLEISDLLPRPAVSTDLGKVEDLLRGKKVLVTGAGGSIGSEIVSQVLSFGPTEVIALDNDETHLFDADMRWEDPDGLISLELCDIRDRQRVFRVFQDRAPDVVFHAAAHKHVPILEAAPEEAVKTNVLGTRNVLDAIRLTDTERFVLISTDKAVDPSSVMGATKRIAEMMTQSATGKSAMVCTGVRFGNVLGSRGSVVPTFMRQIREGGPVTVTDAAMTRYFMTVQEAVELVLQSAALADGGEIFVLDMGEPVKIMDLAHRMIRLAGLIPGKDIDVSITGTREGEKLNEVLSRRPLQASTHPKIRIARPDGPPPVTLMDAINTLTRVAEAGDQTEVASLVHSLAWQTWETSEVVTLPVVDQQYALD